MRRVFVALILATMLASAIAVPAAAQGDYDCSDFVSQAAAQKYFFDFGGSPTNNVDGLDADGDGWACERNQPPYFSGFSASQVDEGGAPAPVVPGTPSTPGTPVTVLPVSGSGGHLASVDFLMSPAVLLLSMIVLGATLVSGGLRVRRSFR